MLDKDEKTLLLELVRKEIIRVAKAKDQTTHEGLKKMYEKKQLYLLDIKLKLHRQNDK